MSSRFLARCLTSASTTAAQPISKSVMPQISEAGRKMLEKDAEHAKAAAESTKLWLKITWWIGAPALALSAINAYMLFTEHEEHLAHQELKFEPYPYLNIMNKRFFWGDGTKTAFFNPKVNAVPDQ